MRTVLLLACRCSRAHAAAVGSGQQSCTGFFCASVHLFSEADKAMGTYPILLSRPGHDKTSPVSRDAMQQHTTYSGIEGTVRLKHSFPCLLTLACGILQLRTGTSSCSGARSPVQHHSYPQRALPGVRSWHPTVAEQRLPPPGAVRAAGCAVPTALSPPLPVQPASAAAVAVAQLPAGPAWLLFCSGGWRQREVPAEHAVCATLRGA